MSTIEREKLKSNAEVIKWYMPVIETLISLGGSAHRKDAVNAVIESSNASQEEKERTIKDGSSALARTIEFARNDLRVEGIIDGSNRGTWKLTDLGWRIIISNELAGMIRSKSVKISAILRKNKKENANIPIPEIDLTPYYRFRDDISSYQLIVPDAETMKADHLVDEELLESLSQSYMLQSQEPEYSSIPREKPEPGFINGRKVYPRNHLTAINALSKACFKCEIDATHPSFLRKHSNQQYTEPHHLIPMAYQDQFEVSLDVEENIVSLCCVCHKEIHYGADSLILVSRLFRERKSALENVGIKIKEETLLAMYR